MVLAAADPRSRFSAAVFGLDVWLRRWHGVFEYAADADCIFRLQIVERESRTLREGAIPGGGRVVRLHLWNEHFPPFPSDGLTLDWARRVSRLIDGSLRRLSLFLDSRSDLDDIRVIEAEMAFGSAAQTGQLLRLSGRFGFTPVGKRPDGSLRARLQRVGEDILINMFVLASNPRAFRLDRFRRDRVVVMLQRSSLDARYLPDRRSADD